MVRPALLLGASLASVASALYIPHDDELGFVKVDVDASPDANAERLQAAVAEVLSEERPGCAGMMSRLRGKKHKKIHGKKHKKAKMAKKAKHAQMEEDSGAESGSDSDEPDVPIKPPHPHPHHSGHHKPHHKPHHSKGLHHPPPPPGEHHPPPPPPGEHHPPPPPPGEHHPPPPPPGEDYPLPPPHGEHVSEHVPGGVIRPLAIESAIADSYIVILNADAAEDALDRLLTGVAQLSRDFTPNVADHPLLAEEGKHRITNVYNFEGNLLRGFSAKLLPGVAEFVSYLPEVAFVEQDSIVHAMSSKEEDQAPWGLARVSHRDKLGLATYNKYLYNSAGGEDVTAYVVDTGIYVDHEDFGGRAVWGKTMPENDVDEDAHGHGSHCAGTIAGNRYGIAKKAKLVAVKVLGSDGSGSMSDVIGGVEYVVASHRAEQRNNPKHKGSTANMSLGGGKSPALDIAVNAATKAGVHFAVAAGNENQDACNVSPAGAKGPVTVGATNVGDGRAYFSNWGSCVDIFAPGVNILSVGTTSPSASAIMSGTSMASPHIAGLLTYFVSLQPSTDSEFSVRGAVTTEELKKHLVAFGTVGVITELDDQSPNVLAFNGGDDDLSKFWDTYTPDEEDDEDSRNPFEKIGEAISDNLDKAVDYIEDIVGDLF